MGKLSNIVKSFISCILSLVVWFVSYHSWLTRHLVHWSWWSASKNSSGGCTSDAYLILSMPLCKGIVDLVLLQIIRQSSLLDVPRLEAMSVSHPAANIAAHEDLGGSDIGWSQRVWPSLSGGEVAQSQVAAQLLLWCRIWDIYLVSQNAEPDICLPSEIGVRNGQGLARFQRVKGWAGPSPDRCESRAARPGLIIFISKSNCYRVYKIKSTCYYTIISVSIYSYLFIFYCARES